LNRGMKIALAVADLARCRSNDVASRQCRTVSDRAGTGLVPVIIEDCPVGQTNQGANALKIRLLFGASLLLLRTWTIVVSFDLRDALVERHV
jgi:hypothetical protein